MIDCNCKELRTTTTLKGDRKHETLPDGVWCGVLAADGTFHPKDHIEPTQAYKDAEAIRHAESAAKLASEEAKAAKVASGKLSLAALKAKLDDGKALTAEDDKAAIAAMVDVLTGE